MPSKVRIISPRNSAEWDELVRQIPDRRETPYGGIKTEDQADKVRRKIKTAARHEQRGAKVYYRPCPDPGTCTFDPDCAYHVLFTLFPIEAARAEMARRSKQHR